MLDLNDLNVVAAAERASIVELEHPATGKPLLDDEKRPYYVEILGEDSAAVAKLDRKHADARADRIRRGKDWGTDSETLEGEAVQRLFAATVSWYLPPLDGETVEFNHKNAHRIYGDPKFAWIVEQVGKAMKDRKRFFSAASTI